MFKLIKIMNSGVNVPEPVMLQKGEREISRGEALVLTAGKATPCGTTTAPTHIALANAEVTDTAIACMAISPNMVFECPITEGSPTLLTVGTKVCLTQKSGKTVGINGTTTSGVATVHDTLGATLVGDKVLITFR